MFPRVSFVDFFTKIAYYFCSSLRKGQRPQISHFDFFILIHLMIFRHCLRILFVWFARRDVVIFLFHLLLKSSLSFELWCLSLFAEIRAEHRHRFEGFLLYTFGLAWHWRFCGEFAKSLSWTTFAFLRFLSFSWCSLIEVILRIYPTPRCFTLGGKATHFWFELATAGL